MTATFLRSWILKNCQPANHAQDAILSMAISDARSVFPKLSSAAAVVSHNAPLHHIEKWTGKFFDATSLNQEGFILYLGHGGELCPAGYIEKDGKETKAKGAWLLLILQGCTNSTSAGANVKLQKSLTFSC